MVIEKVETKPFIYFLSDMNEDRMLLGNKGANLVTMTRLGLPVPPGFVVSIDAYREYRQSGRLPEAEIEGAISRLEEQFGRKLGKGLMVSVRSSGPVSMPGMMDTLLNVRDITEIKSAVRRVFDSWDSLRAVEYRRIHNIPADLGTATIVQAMVFGNRDERSGTGVIFTRNPSTGERQLFGEYLGQAQGEDLVSGARTPSDISTLKAQMPEVYADLEEMGRKLEQYYHDMQDIEFTVESGKLYILQTRSGKRGGRAAVKVAVDMVNEKLLTQEEAILRVSVEDLRALLHKRVASPEEYEPIARGLNAAPGAAWGQVIFDPDEAMILAKKDIPTILVRPETSPDDIRGIAAAEGVLTSRGGLTSHAAIVTRAMGKPCIAGAEEIKIDLGKEHFEVNGHIVKKGDEVTIDGTTGYVYLGLLPLTEVGMVSELKDLMAWASGFKRLGVRANADTPEMVAVARRMGAEGIGLCRTERQFNAPERLSAIRAYILAETPAQRKEALAHLRELQEADFVAIFKELNGVPVIIRLLDLPLHEFLPRAEENKDPWLARRIEELKEINPMLGTRGVRLAVTDPEIYKMQLEAIEAAKLQVDADVSIMLPQIITLQELLLIKRHFEGTRLKVGIMMETVRACMRAGRLAEVAAFFSFGTNDLTQAVFSFSREDVEKKFLTTYLELGLLEHNPFEVIDVKGVGRLMETAIFWARRARRDIEIGVCGEQGGEPRSIRFFHGIGVDYVSCSPYRVPVAKLVAAQTAIKEKTSAEVEFMGQPREKQEVPQ